MLSTILSVCGMVALASAQSTTTAASGSQVTIQASNDYASADLVGSHVGAGLSYMTANSPSDNITNLFVYNSSASSAQLLNNNIAVDYSLPCYVISTSQISNNSGPLECGAGDQPEYYDDAHISPNGTITFDNISSWYVCSVQSFSYGYISNTVVGSFGSGAPSGPGIANCTSIEGLVLTGYAGGNNMTTTTGPTTTTTPVSSTTMVPFTMKNATTTGHTSSTMGSCGGPTAASSVPVSTSTAWMQPYTGAAIRIETSWTASLLLGITILLL